MSCAFYSEEIEAQMEIKEIFLKWNVYQLKVLKINPLSMR